MKKIVLAFIAIVSILSFVHAQSDTLYIIKAGVVVDKFDVNTQIDSVIFYKPTPIVIIFDTITDYDGNVYKTVTIGSQVWMAENLKTTHYADGTAIPLVVSITTWKNLNETSKAYCWYDNNVANKADYGALYTWPAAMNGKASSETNPSRIQGVCPTGWHLPSEAEWVQLENYLADNGYNYDGTIGGGNGNYGAFGKGSAKIAKSLAGTSFWKITSDYKGAVGNTDYPAYRNLSGFTALPSGYRAKDGTFYDFGSNGGWWGATNYTGIYIWNRNLDYRDDVVSRNAYDKWTGMSVRCVKD